MGWQDSVRMGMVGPRHTIANADGTLWFAPKKLSTAASDKISALQQQFLGYKENRAKSKAYAEAVRKVEAAGKKVEELTPEEAEAYGFMEMLPEVDPEYRDALFRAYLGDGVAEHNFPESEENLVCDGKAFDAAAIDEIMRWDPLAAEMAGVIQGFNRPLARKSGESSSSQ